MTVIQSRTLPALVLLAVVFLAAHLPLLPPSLEDIDSINFALGVREFDVARHQPHPPGYPLFIALGKLSTSALRWAEVPAAEVRGLAAWSALAGAAAVFALFALFRALGAAERRAWWATIAVLASPLFWFTALRPLSDTTGLAAALVAQALLAGVLLGRGSGPHLAAGALVAGLAIGARSQTFVLTLPLLAAAIARPGARLAVGPRVAAMGAFMAGVLAWAVPLVLASGGLTEYLVALGSQAGEDFEGVEMLWHARSPRVLVQALLYTFVWPWAHLGLGALVLGAAALGIVVALRESPRSLLVLALAFAPYAAFHLLFHEYEMVRYALPLVVPVGYLAATALDIRPRWAAGGVTALAAASLVLTLPAAWIYSREPSPGARLVQDVRALASETPGTAGDHPLDLAYHLVFRRQLQWDAAGTPARLLKAPHGREWLTLLTVWRSDPGRRIAFAADPRRTDLSLFDPQGRRLMRGYRWSFPEPPFVGGSRPAAGNLYVMQRPGWMLDRGWALTAELGGITERDGLGPHREPSLGWIRTRESGALLMLGGRHVGGETAPPARVSLELGGRPLETFDVAPGPFFRLVPVEAGALHRAGHYVPLSVAARPADGAAEVPVRLEQFDLQSSGVPMVGFADGWHEPEYNRKLGRGWRWMSERATLWVRPVGRDVTLRISGESALRYFDRAPVVRVVIGEREVFRFEPRDDFVQTIVLPAPALEASGGRVVFESDLWFVPPGPDPRRLALRVFEIAGFL